MGSKDREERERELRRAVKEFPEDANAWYHLGALLFLRGAEPKPRTGHVFYDFGSSVGGWARYAEAEEAPRQSVEIDPNNVRAWFVLALTFSVRGAQDKACSAFAEAVKHDGQFLELTQDERRMIEQLYKGRAKVR